MKQNGPRKRRLQHNMYEISTLHRTDSGFHWCPQFDIDDTYIRDGGGGYFRRISQLATPPRLIGAISNFVVSEIMYHIIPYRAKLRS